MTLRFDIDILTRHSPDELWNGVVASIRRGSPETNGGLKGDQVKRLKELEAENTRLRRAISDLTLDKLILQEAARGNF